MAGCTHPSPGLRAVFEDGLRAAWPICLGYFPIGLAFGVLSRKAGLEPWQVGAMSVLVFAGSSQFIAVAMLDSGASLGSIVTTTFVVNLRHLLMSSALALPLRGSGRGFLSLFAYGVTDESFAVNGSLFRGGGWDGRRALVVNQAANAAWIGSTVSGAYAGGLVPGGALGIDYALTAMFLCLLVFQIRSGRHAATALVAGGLAVALSVALPGNAYVVIASVAAATIGYAAGRGHRGEELP